ncbi:uncharacterized protein LOC127797717 [Diospyros lotus]|uniref:uncharacterized protein LOC127797717 n=1 Tax=Diospyros lotus TaxID=55363 RepID=UPI002253BA14|nr:uncharacterized protein LOC127797717 [Diospyros lotus]
MGTVAEAVHSCHSLPLSMLERARGATMNATSLAQHLGTSLETPNWLSEEMIKCISAIYIELADPPSIDHGLPLSPVSSSSVADSSPQHQSNIWSPETRRNPSFYSSMESAFSTEGSNELGGAYSTMIEVQRICRDGQSLKRVKNMLQQFRSFVLRLEEVHPEKMRHEEKIAFWINVHNSLVMHAFLVYGIPQNNLKRISLLLKAAYNVGGHTITVDMIQNSILGCRLPRPGQWLQALFFPKAKSKSRDTWKASALKHPEPRLYFALCSGSHSDPAVRMYTPKGVFQELEAAKDDYIHTNLRVHKEHKILLPKLVDSFAKKSGLCPAAFMEMIEHFMPHSAKKRLIQQHRHGRFWKKIEWTPHNHSFRYLLGKELLK